MFSADVLLRESKLPMVQLRLLFCHVLGHEHVPQEETDVSPGDCLVFWIFGTLVSLGMDAAQVQLLVYRIAEKLRTFGHICSTDPTEYPEFIIAISDGRYAAWTGRTGYFDIETGEDVEKLERVTHVSLGINVAQTFIRGTVLCAHYTQQARRRADHATTDNRVPGNPNG